MGKPRRRSNGKLVRQKGHGKQRPRSFHHGAAEGVRGARKLDAVAPAFEQAEADRAEIERNAVTHRAAVSEWEALLDGCARVSSSCALAPLPAVLL